MLNANEPKRRKKLTRKRKRRNLVEKLEERQLLSAMPLTTAQRDTLKADLSSIAVFADRVENHANEPIALLGTSIGSAFDASQIVQERFVDQLVGYLNDEVANPNPSSDDIAAFLTSDTIVGTFGDVDFRTGPTTGSENADGDLVFDTTLFATQSVAYDLVIGADAASQGLRVSDQGTVDADFSIEMDLQFGVDGSGEFFVAIDDLQLGVTDSARVLADQLAPEVVSLTDPVTFTLVINDTVSVTATLPANTSGNLTPLTSRLNEVLEQPLADAGFADAILATVHHGRLSFQANSPSATKLELKGQSEDLSALGFDNPVVGDASFLPELGYGLLGLETITGGIAIEAAANVTASTGGDGRLSTSELTSTAAITISNDGAGAVQLNVRPSASGLIISTEPTIDLTANDLFDSVAAIATLSDFAGLDELQEQAKAILVEGLASITQFGDTLTSNTPLANSLPAMETSLGEALDLKSTLRAQLQQPIDDLLATNSRPSWDEVRAALESVAGVTATLVNEDSDSVSLNVTLDSTKTSQQQLFVGTDAEDAGLAVADNNLPELTLSAQQNWDLQLQINRQRTQAPLDAFAVRFDALESTAAAIGAVTFDAQVGFLGMSASGNAGLAATLATTVSGGQVVTASELRDAILTNQSSGDFDLDLQLDATLGGQEVVENASLSLPAAIDVFSGDASLQPIGFDTLQNFINVTPDTLEGALAQFAGWLGDFSESELGGLVPLAAATRFGDAVQLQKAFENQILSVLKDDEGQLQFTTAQQFAGLSSLISNPVYDAANRQLTFDVAYAEAIDPLAADLSFDLEIGQFVGLSSDANVTVSPSVSGTFRLGIDMRALGEGDSAITVSESTRLADINEGMGVVDIESGSGDDVQIMLRSGEDYEVSFDGHATLGEVLATINAASADLNASLYDVDGIVTGIRLVDASDGESVFSVKAVDGSLAGFGLGILGEAEDSEDDGADAVIDGSALHGDSVAHHLYVEEINGAPIATGKVELVSENFAATANLGFTDVTIDAGKIRTVPDAAGAGLPEVPSNVAASVGLPRPKMTLAELFDGIADGAEQTVATVAEFVGQVQIELPTLAIFGEPDTGVNDDDESGTVIATITEFGGDLVADVGDSFNEVLERLSEIDAGDILDGLKDGLADLLSLDGLTIPILNIDLPDAAGLQGLLTKISNAIDTVGSSTLNVLSEGINRLAALDPASPEIDFPEIDIAFPDLFSFFHQASDMAPAEGSNETFSLPDFDVLLRDLFDFEISLPSVDVPADEFASFLSGVSTILEELQLTGPGSLQGLERVLEEAIGLDENGVSIQVITAGVAPGAIELRFDLDVGQTVDATYPLSIDLADLGIGGVGDLIDVSGSSTVDLMAEVQGQLSLGLEISSGDSVRFTPFLYTDAGGTQLSLTAGATASDINFEASLGPLGIGIVNGVAGINASGNPADANPASFSVTLEDIDSDGRYLFGDSLAFETNVSGGAYATLPIDFPVGANFDLVMSVNDNDLRDGVITSSNFDALGDEIENRISQLGNVGDNLLAMVGGWEGAFDLLTDAMRGDVLGVPLPLIGEALADEADFLQEIKQSVLDNIENVAEQGTTQVQIGIFEALGPAGLDLLLDSNNDNLLTSDDVLAVIDTVNNRVDFDINLRKAVEKVALPIDFDLGLPGLNFDIDAPVELSFGADFRLGFGASIDDGFFFVTDPARTQLEIFFDAEVPEVDATGQLTLLEVTAQEIVGSPNQFAGSFVVNVNDDVVGNGDGLLTMSEMFAGSFSDVINHTLSANADVALQLEVTVGDDGVLPRLRTDLIVDWDFVAGQNDNAPTVSFENVQMNLGDFFSGFAGDVLSSVQDVLEPVQPVIDVLTQRLPVLSDLGGSDVTFIDLARMFGRADVANFIESVSEVNDLVTGLPDIGPDTWVDMGQFNVDPGALGGFGGPGSTVSSGFGDLTMSGIVEESNTLGQASSKSGAKGSKWTNNLQDAKGSLSFPILESPLTAFKLLLGKDVDLFLYDAPALGVDFSYYQSLPTPIPGLFAEIGGRIAAVADFAFGFDTTGITKFNDTGDFGDIFDGFFVSDRINADGTGADVPEAYLRGSLTAGAKVDFLIANAGVRGGIFADVDFNLHDNDGDGRVRWNEIAQNFDLGPIHIFDVDGKVDAGLTAFLNVNLLLFSIEEEHEIARVNLLDFEVARPASDFDPLALLTSRTPKADGTGDVLTINFTQQDDVYKVQPGSQSDSIIIQGQGHRTEDIVGIVEIVGDALGGNDTITISPKVDLPVTLSGGDGDDLLTAGGGAVNFTGGAGNDTLTGGSGEDTLDGGIGEDVLSGNEGDDHLDGGDGDDYLDGGRNADTLLGGAGDDQILGGFGADYADGGADQDVIDGGRDRDELRGGSGDDQISGGRGDDFILGGAGDDVLLGEEGADEIDGGDDADLILGGERNDELRGGAGNDTIRGGTGNDEISGGADDDELSGNEGGDEISGDAGNDLIFADNDAAGDDADAEHMIAGGSGDDTIYASRGDDRIDAGGGNDIAFALAGDDVVIGGLGNDDLDGGLGNDLVWGGLAGLDASSFDLSDPSLFEEPLRFDEVTAAYGSSYSLPLLVTPKAAGGQSVSGSLADGDDLLRGGEGTDWLFGGSGSDVILGGAGIDYIDGGSGDDLNLLGGDGDDVIRGGSGSDIIHGGLGIDQSYGDEGRDTIYGDEGAANGSTDGQRAFGGADVDSLYAWAAGDASDLGAKGDELFGESGGDFLYGNLRNDLLVGEAGSDYLSGDWASGPNYLRNQDAALNIGLGGDDTLLGGTGQDQAYGGGGNDFLEGGGDGDWLEGQDGNDELVGGGGIDFLVLDVNPMYSVLGGESFDGHGGTTLEDNATDVLLINGTPLDDIIRLSASSSGQLRVSYNGALIDADWTSDDGTPLVEQFRIDGGVGDDMIAFSRTDASQGIIELDLSVLNDRSRDWATAITGGSGDDTLIGSGGRDRIDGGRGSDLIFGFAGDDRLWGDEGSGSVADHDVVYAGQGNDDVLGGQGTNDLYAWSSNPGVFETDTYPASPDFGVIDSATGELEDTGLNRIIGGGNDDRLFGGTGLDLLYGAEGDNQLYTRTGKRFESLDGGDAGNEWKEYAKSTEQVWYVGGTNVADQISIDFVTEPGILQGHHLVTRLTENNGAFSFDAQVRLDFAATDDDGNLVWDPETVFFGDDLLSDDPFARAEALNQKFSDSVALSTLLPPEDDFRAIIVDALGGDDIINVGPTVQKTVWIDAGEGDDEVLIASGRAILIDRTDNIDSRNDSLETAYELLGPPVIVGDAVSATNGILTDDASFYLIVDDLEQDVLVTIPAAVTDGTGIDKTANATLSDVVDDINRQIERTEAAGRVIATVSGDAIALSTTSIHAASRLAISIPADDPAKTQLGLPVNESTLPASLLSRSVRFTDLTIDNPSDVDFYRFTVDSDRSIAITAPSQGADDGMQIAVFDGETPVVADGNGRFALTAGIQYTISVNSDSTPTIYELKFDFGDNSDSVVSNLGAIVEFERRDVIFGGPGNDVLQGGPAEDFIFGGAGNDVLTGGDDSGTSDLLFGQDGEDIFQAIPGSLPTLTGTSTTFVPTQSDRFDGGMGQDSVVYLGGDIDANGMPINDLAAIRFNRLLQRYEISDVAWDTANQQFATVETDEGLQPLRRWSFYRVVDIEETVVDLRRGDDEFHADPEYVFPGDQTLSEFGLAAGDNQASGGSLLALRIAGGEGNDKLFGSAYRDILIGGDGDDNLLGGLGDDILDGGDGDDTILGESGLVPNQSFREVEINFENFAPVGAELPPIHAGTVQEGLFSSSAGGYDYYVVEPVNEFGFVDQLTPHQVESRLIVHETIAGVRNGSTLPFSLSRVQNVGSESSREWEGMRGFDQFDVGVGDAYVIRVGTFQDTSPRTYEIELVADPAGAAYAWVDRLTKRDQITNAAQDGFERSVIDMSAGAAGTGVVVPSGDFDGDGHTDYLLSVDDNDVFLYYGGAGILDPTVIDLQGQSVTQIDVSGPIFDEIGSTQTGLTRVGQAGDFDGDGIDDLLFATGFGSQIGTVIVFGGPRVARIDAEVSSDRTAVLSSYASSGSTSLDATGIRNIDAVAGDEIVEVDEATVRVFSGRTRAEWQAGGIIPDATYSLSAARVRDLGDIDGDGNNDIGALSDNQVHVLYGTGSDLTSLLVQTIDSPVSNGFQGSQLVEVPPTALPSIADFVISGPTDGLGPLLVTDLGTSYLIDIDSSRNETVTSVPVPMLRPIGDFSGDGRSDFAATRLQSDGLSPNVFPAFEYFHAVTHVYVSDSSADLLSRLSSASPSPHLVFEKSDAHVQANRSPFVPTFTTIPTFGSIDDVNGDGIEDLAVFSSQGSGFAVIFGAELRSTSLIAVATATEVQVVANHESIGLGWQRPITTQEQDQQVGIDILAPSSINLADAIKIDGSVERLRLNSVRAIGDVNDDGQTDMIATSTTGYQYVVFGPLSETGVVDIDQVSNLVFSKQALFDQGELFVRDGQIIPGSGDIDGDGSDDLIAMRPCNAANCQLQLDVFSGGEDLPQRLIDGVISDTLGFTFADPANDARFIDWDGEGADGVLVSTSVADENSDNNRIATVVEFGSPTNNVINFFIDTSALDPPSQSSGILAASLGDINGDGKDDVAFAHDNGVFVVLGGKPQTASSIAIELTSQSDFHIPTSFAARGLQILGDLDGDGYDEFAIETGIEGAGDQQGAVLIYRGGESWNESPGLTPEPWIIVSQATLPDAVTLASDELYTAVGDLDHDGKSDLVIGNPNVRTSVNGAFPDLNERGTAYVFFDVVRFATEDSNNVVLFSQADRRFVGTSTRSNAGHLGDSRLADFNGDGIDDLWIGSPGPQNFIYTLAGAGQVRFIPGKARGGELPRNDEVTLLQNRGDLIVDSETGVPERFDGDAFQILEGESEVWFQMTTGGDGSAQSNVSDYVRVESNDDTIPLRIDLISASGQEIKTRKTLVDLRNQPAGKYFVRVYRDSSVAATPDVSFVIEVDPPAFGYSHPVSDRDRLMGGNGEDSLSGGSDFDVLVGGDGADLYIGGNELEPADLRKFVSNTLDTFTDQADSQILVMTDEIVEIPANTPSALVRAIGEAIGLAITGTIDTPVFHRPIYASDLSEIESLDLSSQGFADLSGFDVLADLIHLRHLDLSDNPIVDFAFPAELAFLEELVASNSAIESVSRDSLATMPNLKRLVLDGSPVSDLSDLVGIKILDDGDAGYSEGGQWKSQNGGDDAWLGDYRTLKESGSASWVFDVASGTAFEVLVTWPSNAFASESASYSVSGATPSDVIQVDQSQFPGAGLTVIGGQSWLSLGNYVSTGAPTVQLVGAGNDTIYADAVMVRAVQTPAIDLESISLIGTPVDAFSRDHVLPQLAESHPELAIEVTANESAPLIAPIGPQFAQHHSLVFNDDAATLPESVLDGLDSFMVSFWYRADQLDTRAMFSTAAADNAANEFTFFHLNATTFRVLDHGAVYDFTTPNVDDGQWHHYAVLRDADTATLLLSVDGGSISPNTIADTSAISVSPGGLVLGQDQDDVGGRYSTADAAQGQLDELAIWDKFWVSTGVEQIRKAFIGRVTSSKDGGLTASSPELRAYYKFDETSGDSIIDSTSNARHGKLGDHIVNLLDVDRDTRPRPTRGANAPITESILIDAQTIGGQPLDADGQTVVYTAWTDNPNVLATVSGSTIELNYPGDFVGADRITVAATDGFGRQTSTSFDLNVDNPAPTDLAGVDTTSHFVDGVVYLDANTNGLRDDGEAPLEGVVIHLRDQFGEEVACSITDANGYYRVSGDLIDRVSTLELQLVGSGLSSTTPVSVDLAQPNTADYSYDFDVDPADPTLIDRDGNDFSDITFVGTDFGSSAAGGILTLVSGQNLGDNSDTQTIWPSVGPSFESGYSVEFRMKVIIDPAFPEGPRGTATLAASHGTNVNAWLSINSSNLRWGASTSDDSNVIDTSDNTDDFHTFQVIQVPGQDAFYVFRDGVQINATPLSSGQTAQVDSRLYLGDGGSVDAGKFELDYLRFKKGAPFVHELTRSAIDFGVSRNLDIGSNRSVDEGRTQSFTAGSPVALSNHVWTVTNGATTIATGAGETFDFTPPDPGEYIVSVTADDVGGQLTDQITMTVNAANPLTGISTTVSLPAAENTPIEFTADVIDAVGGEFVASYVWMVTDQAGDSVVIPESGTLTLGESIPTFTFTPTDQGILTVGLSVVDNEGDSSYTQQIIEIENAAPVVLGSNTSQVVSDGKAVIAGTATDTDADFLRGEVDFGDGTRAPLVLKSDSTFESEHEFATPGVYEVVVTVVDEDGQSQQQTFDVTFDPDVLTTTVTTTADSGKGSLREAILMANDGVINRIDFDIPGTEPHVIDVLSPLPVLTVAASIDGTTEPDYVGIPVVGLNGVAAGIRTDGLQIRGANATVKGLAIYNFGGDGIEIIGGQSHIVSASYLGLNPDGDAAGNFMGLRIVDSFDNLIDGNVISGNERAGVFINSTLAFGNTVINNRIGTDPTGMRSVANATDGITLYSANNQIGRPGEGNLISGNSRWGVFTRYADRSNNRIQSNLIGVDATGRDVLPNSSGVMIQNGPNQIGGPNQGEGNVISANLAHGITLSTSEAVDNVLQGNFIGTDIDGTMDLGNRLYGIAALRARDNTIGGDQPGEGNVISGNGRSGVHFVFADTTGNEIVGNRIGTDVTGETAVPNGQDGTSFVRGARNNTIRANQISGNLGRAVVTDTNSSNNDVLFNLIGTDSTGTEPIHNGNGGAIRMRGPDATIQGNTISGPDVGILAFHNATDLVIADNFIGTDASETSTTLETRTGIQSVAGAENIQISNNVIANNLTGVYVPSGNGIRIQGNSIYDNSIGIDLGERGETANDPFDIDSGANNLQNSPVVSEATLVGDQLTLTYLVDSKAIDSAYHLQIEFFISDGNRQGKTLIGSNTYLQPERRTDKTITLTVVGVNIGDQLLATATDADGNTSEFGVEITIG